MRCMACGGAAHPATGCQYTVTAIVCGPCVREFWAWLRVHVDKKPSKRSRIKADFYGAAGRWR